MGDGSGGTAYAHKWCAPTLDDIRQCINDVIAEAEGRRIVLRWAEDSLVYKWPEAAVPLLEKAPENLVFDERLRPCFPGLPDSRFVPEGYAEGEGA